ncbi:MAG: histidine kinase [Rubrivivax sp.]|nr:histidine kinase [Rubrivivax sp.]
MPAEPCPERDGKGLSPFLRRGLLNQLVCLVISLGFWTASPAGHGLWAAALYSYVIGNLIWLIVDGGRQLMVRLLGPGRERDWPGWLTMAPLVAIGGVGGYSVGSTIVDALLGLRSPSIFASRGSGLVTLLVAAAVTYGYYTRERLQAEKAEAEQARRLALENQLKLLESQLEPHMLFNTLANLRVLIGVDPARAQAMLDRLIAFLRAMLGGARAQRQPLHAEFERLADYLALMAVRMGERLVVHFELPAALRDCEVPSLLLQPLVENAIRHGLEPKVAGGRIDVAAAREGGTLRLTVRDSGVGIDPAAATTDSPRAGLGTANVRERLAALYGDAARLELQPLDEGGTLATVTLPFAATTATATASATAAAA